MDLPLRILSVDNEASVTIALKYVFSGPRYELRSADSGEAALAQLADSPIPFDLIIVDQKMPNFTGVQLVAEIRKRGIVGKIIILSALLSSEIREAYEQMEVEAILSKPFDLGELRATVEQLAAA